MRSPEVEFDLDLSGSTNTYFDAYGREKHDIARLTPLSFRSKVIDEKTYVNFRSMA